MTKPVTPETLTDEMVRELLEVAHELPIDVRHAASCVRYSPGVTASDRRKVCDAINARALIAEGLHQTDETDLNTPISCGGLHDDGIADGNLTRCSTRSGCGLPGCPYRIKP